jgi:hypothetical protein
MSPNPQIQTYLDRLESQLEQLDFLKQTNVQVTLLSPSRANLRFMLRLACGSRLFVSEALMVECDRLVHLDYRYHFQDKKNALIFRYDCTPHFPNLSTFPHHKHCRDRVIDSEKPELFDVIQEAIMTV